MDYIVAISKTLGEYRRIFSEGEAGLSLNEALILEAVSSTDGRVISISEFLFKDRAYVYRLLKRLRGKKMVSSSRNIYSLTPDGIQAAAYSRELLRQTRVITETML